MDKAIKKQKNVKEAVKYESDEVQEETTNNTDDEFDSDNENIDSGSKQIKGAAKINKDGTWEDIYGRLRSEDGSILTEVSPINMNDNVFFCCFVLSKRN